MGKEVDEMTKPVNYTLGNDDNSFIADIVENGQKIKRLRALIAEGDADLQAGHFTEDDNSEDLFKSVTE